MTLWRVKFILIKRQSVERLLCKNQSRLQDIQGWRRASWSQLIVKLVLLSQVDPTEDERSQGQSEHHDEDRGAGVAFVLNLARSWGEGRPVGSISVISLAVLLGAPLPGAKRATGTGGGSRLGSFYSRGRGCLCLRRNVERDGIRGGFQKADNKHWP